MGTGPLSYQWQKGTAAISGAASASYTTAATTTSDSGSQFSVTVTNSAGNIASNPATLTVTAAPVSALDYATTGKPDGDRGPDSNFLGGGDRNYSLELPVAEGNGHNQRRDIGQLHDAPDHNRRQWHAV